MNLPLFVRRTLHCVGLLLVLLYSSSCTEEDLTECDYYLLFRYDYNLANEDWFAQQVEEVKVFLFDKKGGYVLTLCDTVPTIALAGYKMKIPYAMKGYSAIVWAGRTHSYQLPTLHVGDPKEKLTLLYEPLNNKSDKAIDNLWHSGPTQLLFPDDRGTTQTISLLRNTNDFAIQLRDLHGVSHLATHTITITSPNGSYDYTNAFLPSNPPIAYSPHNMGGEVAQLRTLRLLTDDHITLRVTNQEGRPIDIGGKTDIDLIEFLIHNKPASMTAQEFLDRCYLWEITLTIKDELALCIKINNWVLWFHQEEI